jgi:hypothetical protein
MEEKQKIKGNGVIVVLRSDGIVDVLDNKEWDQQDTLKTAKEDTSLMKKVIDGQPGRCILVEIPSRYVSREILNHYQSVELEEVARALLLNSFAAKVVGNLYLKLSKEKPNEAGRIVPAKLFTKKRRGDKVVARRNRKS